MKLRPAINSDRAAIEALIFPILTAHNLAPDPEGTDSDLHDIEAVYDRQGGCFDLYKGPNSQVLATVAVFRTNTDRCELRKMYLHESMRGHGRGRQLLEHAIRRARELGFREMWLETATSLVAARALYRAHDFQPFNAPHLSTRCDEAMIRSL